MDISQNILFLKSNLSYKFLGNFLWQYILFIFTFILIFILKKIFDATILKKIRNIAYKTEFEVDNLIYDASLKPFSLFIYIVSFNFSLSFINIADKFKNFISNTITVLLYATLTYFFYNLVDIFEFYFKEFAERTRSEVDKDILSPVKKSIKLIIIIIGSIITAENIGYNLTGIIAGLGVGGIAISLAAKDTISNLFGSFTVFADTPFKSGDHIEIKGISGIVQSIGIRSTKIKDDNGCIISVPNSSFVSSTIKNISKQKFYKRQGSIKIIHNNSSDKIKNAENIIVNIINNIPEIYDEHYVWFDKYDPNSISINYIYKIKKTDQKHFLKINEKFNLDIAEKLDEKRIELNLIN